MFNDLLASIPDWITKLGAVLAALLAIVPVAWKFYGWYFDRKKKYNVLFLEWRISLLEGSILMPLFILEASSLKMLRTNKPFRTIFNGHSDMFEGKSWTGVIKQSEREGFLNALRTAIKEQSDFSYEAVSVIAGRNVHILWTARPFVHLKGTRAVGGTVEIKSRGDMRARAEM